MRHIQHTFLAARYSWAGFLRLIQETAAQAELLLFAFILLVFAMVGADPAHYAIITMLFLFTFSVEALNTAIEVLVDHLTNEFAEFAQHAKDLGSFAVFCGLAMQCCYGLYVVYLCTLQ